MEDTSVFELEGRQEKHVDTPFGAVRLSVSRRTDPRN